MQRSRFAKRNIRIGCECLTIAETLWRGISAVKLKRCPLPTLRRWCGAKTACFGNETLDSAIIIRGIMMAERAGTFSMRTIFAATEKGKKMINAKGEVIYTNAEIAYELGIAPATVNAIGKRLFGNGRIPHWTLNDAKLIVEYIKSISVEEDAQRLSILHDAVHEIMGNCKLDAADTRKRVDKDIHLMSKG